MKLKELKRMIAEEYSLYLKEQAAMPAVAPTPPMPPAGGPPGPPQPGPGISVEPDDIQVDDDGNAEEMLQNIYNMLKTHFEADAPEPAPIDNMGDDDMADMDAGDEEGPEDVETDEEDEEADLEEWRGKGDPAAKTTHGGQYGPKDYKKATKTSNGKFGAKGYKQVKALQESTVSRLQKLANISK